MINHNNQNNRRNTNNNSLTNFRKDERFEKLLTLFESMFKSRGYNLNEKISKNIWFLKDKNIEKFYVQESIKNLNNEENIITDNTNKIKQSEEEIIFAPMKALLESTLINNKKSSLSNAKRSFSNNKTVYNKIFDMPLSEQNNFNYIIISDFIINLCEKLLVNQNITDSCYDNINHHFSNEKIDLINYKINDLQNVKEKVSFNSSINISLCRLDCLPEGNYSFRLVLKELDKNFNMIKYDRGLTSNKKIKILNSCQYVNLFEMNLNKKDISFKEVFIHSLDQKKLKEYIDSEECIYLKSVVKQKDLDKDITNKLNKSKLSLKEININQTRKFSKSVIREENESISDNMTNRKEKDYKYSKDNHENEKDLDDIDSNTLVNNYKNNNKKYQRKSSINVPVKKNSILNSMNNKSNLNLSKYNANKSNTSISYINNELNMSSNVNTSLLNNNQSSVFLQPIDFEFENNSGTSLVSFGLVVERNGEFFGESNENFLDFLLIHTDELLDSNKKSIKSNYMSGIRISENIQARYNLNYNQINIVIGIDLLLTKEIKSNILERIQSILKANITLKNFHETQNNILLENYFSDISKEAYTILRNIENRNETGACCEKCSIF